MPSKHAANLTIMSTDIRRDKDGRFCLNDCHKASGGSNSKRPSLWLTNAQTKELIEELAENSQSKNSCFGGKQPVSTVKGGNNPGTFACKELVYAYAMWINPKFHLAVIRAFDAMVQGEAKPAQKPKRVRRTPVLQAFGTGYKIAQMLGYESHQAVTYADVYCEKKCGERPAALMGIDQQALPNNEPYFTPTELAHMHSDSLSAITVNKMLADAGLQEVKWKKSVLEAISLVISARA